MIDENIVHKLRDEMLERDQQEFDKFKGANLEDNNLVELYRYTSQDYFKVAAELYNCAWQSYEQLKDINIDRAEEVADIIGMQGLAHSLVGHIYKNELMLNCGK